MQGDFKPSAFFDILKKNRLMKKAQKNIVFGTIGNGLKKILADLHMFDFSEAEPPKSFFELKNIHFQENTRLIFIGGIPSCIKDDLLGYLLDHIDGLNRVRCTISFICLRKNIETLCTYSLLKKGEIAEVQKSLRVAA